MTSAARISLDGFGLHGGRASKVVIARRPGPVTLQGRTLDDLEVVATASATTVASRDGAVRMASVEHLFAALGGLGVRDGLAIAVVGDELPLLDGASARWASAILSLDPPRGAVPALVVRRDAEIAVGASVYRFEVEPGRCELGVAFETADARLARDAVWCGDAADFLARIATARTFAMAEDIPALATQGLASRVTPEAVVVVGDAIHCAGAPFGPDEPARHKLLDAIGDFYLHGGPPRGRVHATRPGHRATHAAVARALALGVLTCAECAA
jgi:UDP-3-O-[3-hydroxymyristoyl] N-acetylglucosamine deacetylase